ncbi:helix-turn-helix domain-containing protein [Marinoscillum furvescens]|uniref:Helix-turn-helix protein n=1 Tax=Marinoscillum furvescens DSM 4134 TaxID=1122208 RepID=A0A3D9L4X9_MARFU|nr:helix-turn-helix domain-containing protein [Marinoscillum furvescens]RED99464.1 helix-turn-helix protein [Marinoscillum furvescens DSM 4134]
MDQQTALAILKSGENVYLTGSAGTGKTYLLNQYIEYLRTREVPLAVTASTGIAATHIGGQTIHSWSGIGIRDSIGPKDLEKIALNKQTVSRLTSVKVLIIDEISMLSGKVLMGISTILKHFRKSQEAFGGVQVVITGDFFQLPPVSREPLSNREKFAFMAPVWVEARLKICYLTTQYRQGRDALSIILSEIRSQDVTDDSLDRIREKLEEDNSNEQALKLYTHNADVDAMNAQKLKENPNRLKTFYAETKGQSKLVEGLKSSVLAAPIVELKQDARVMFVKNNPEKGYFNGTIGTVVGYDTEEGYPLVKLENDRTIVARPEEWTVTDEKETILASLKQVPLRLAWAITVHKSQGMTLDHAEMDLSKTFEAGQGYVALSRLKSWDGLSLLGINPSSLRLDTLAVKADKRFQELSEESEDWINVFSEGELDIRFKDFITRCGGTNDPDVIASNQQREKKYYKKEKKVSTYKKTLALLKAGKGLDEVAFDRDLSMGTIIGHLEQLLLDDPDLDLSAHRPDQKTISKVEKAIEAIKKQHNEEYLDKDGRVKLGAIYKATNGSLDYEEIRLARLFVS